MENKDTTFTDIRRSKGFTQESIASALKIKQSTVAMWETGKSVPGMKNLIKLAELLGVSYAKLVKSFPKNK